MRADHFVTESLATMHFRIAIGPQCYLGPLFFLLLVRFHSHVALRHLVPALVSVVIPAARTGRTATAGIV